MLESYNFDSPKYSLENIESDKDNLRNLINSWRYIYKSYGYRNRSILGHIAELFCKCYLGVNLNAIQNQKDTDRHMGCLSVQIKSKSFFEQNIDPGIYFDLGLRKEKADLYYFLVIYISESFDIECITVSRHKLEKYYQKDKNGRYLVNVYNLFKYEKAIKFGQS